jgi:hypothetical protein
MSSMAQSNVCAMRNAKGREGSNFSRSIEMIVCRETPSAAARSACVQLRPERRSARLFFTSVASSLQCAVTNGHVP